MLPLRDLRTSPVKESAFKDKKNFIAAHLRDFHAPSIQQWRTARHIRKPFVPCFVNLFDIHGKLSTKKRTCLDDTFDDNGSHPPISSKKHPINMDVPRGYQDRRALRGSHQGQRLLDSRQRSLILGKIDREAPGRNSVNGDLAIRIPP